MSSQTECKLNQTRKTIATFVILLEQAIRLKLNLSFYLLQFRITFSKVDIGKR